MSKLPTRITYVVGIEDGIERSLCIEASSATRLGAFKRRVSDHRQIEQPFGRDHRGRPIDSQRLRVIRRQLYRHLTTPRADSQKQEKNATEILQTVAEEHSIKLSEIFDTRTRKPEIKMARRTAAIRLKRELELDEKEIAKILGFKSPAYVAVWLRQDDKQSRASRRGIHCPRLTETSQPSF
ncbi:hypothetical protein DA075_06610 [Methylobacterium currus]|uniref:Uncharacterized protein n=1 Tax=Methylobacterium currus TaxID=2051553 RepID=A0A2R4WGH1_9HYPH|nr:hypothetical protein [Methylobacterium currus]AWB20635.1 hypothetical protein DA075_06610 [Methylobacterium currus]